MEKPFAEWSAARAEQGSSSRLGVAPWRCSPCCWWDWGPCREHRVVEAALGPSRGERAVSSAHPCSSPRWCLSVSVVTRAVLPRSCFSDRASSLPHPRPGVSVEAPGRSWAASVLQTMLCLPTGTFPLVPLLSSLVFLYF